MNKKKIHIFINNMKPKQLLQRILISIVLCTWAGMVFGQYNIKENNVWAFGTHEGFDLNGAFPHAINTNISGDQTIHGSPTVSWLEGSAAVSDSNGNLLFYCTADSIWNRNGQVMAHGYWLMPCKNALGHDTTYYGYSTTQGTVIAPVIDSPGKYYVFALQQLEDWKPPFLGAHLYYSVIDMSLNGGLGDVDTNRKGILLDSMLSEKMITVPGNNCDIWLLVHRFDSAIFKVYNINSNGINAMPVLSKVGMNCLLDSSYRDGFTGGVMKCSPFRDKIVVCNLGAINQNNSFAELFNFDFITGAITSSIGVLRSFVQNNITYDTIGFYGASFSPDNQSLYLASDSFFQYNISSNDINIIANSKYTLGYNLNGYSDMKLGPDGKIYSVSNPYFLSFINSPNLSGSACGYFVDSIFLNGFASMGLPNEYSKPCFQYLETPKVTAQEGIKIYPNPVQDILQIDNAEAGCSITVYDLLGRVLYNALLNNSSESIDAHNWLAGNYIVVLKTPNGNRQVKQVLKW